MNSRGVQITIAVVFFVVAVLSMVNTYRLNEYVRETLPRDAAQEECNAKTVAVLADWVRNRNTRDDAMDGSGDALGVVLDDLLYAKPVEPEKIRAWRAAVAAERTVRAATEFVPLPDC